MAEPGLDFLETGIVSDIPPMPKSKNKKLKISLNAKNDDFYTPMDVIEKTVPLVRDFLNGKTVYLNCDNWRISNFYKHFKDNFKEYKLKRLICTGIKCDGIIVDEDKTTILKFKEIHSDNILDYSIGKNEISDGSFDSQRCIEFAKEADIVITNPPFSLLSSRYWDLMIWLKRKHGTDFLFIGPVHLITVPNKFHCFINGELHVHGYIKGDYIMPDGKIRQLCNTTWFSSLPLPKTPLNMKTRDLSMFEKSDDSILNVPEISLIPDNYFGLMAVPITYPKFHNPELFDVLGIRKISIKGKFSFQRILIKRKV